MAEESFEILFGSCVLEVFTPDTSISFPEGVVADEWLASVKKPYAERKQAFFDEHLSLLLLMHVKHPSLDNPHNPPRVLIDFLTHVQISLEATYISQDIPDTSSLVPPSTSSTPKGGQSSLHPSIFPPNTPNPIPSIAESDRKYVQSEGKLLFSNIWGTRRMSEVPKEKFALMFSEAQKSWIAVYELSLIVSYLRLSFSDPLLCLTTSVTLRDKALSLSQTAHPLIAYLVKTGSASFLDSGFITAGVEDDEDEDDESHDTGFEEINLLEGLTLGSNTPLDPESLYLPSTRLGNATRQRHFSLPLLSTPTRTPPSTSKQTPSHVLRKSYRKVLQTVSGFRVRMRTVFIPHVLLPKTTRGSGQGAYHHDDFVNESEEREAGNSERTVVLCVEIENSGESGSAMGFALERLDVKIGGEGATTRLIGWGDGAFNLDVENHLFPLLIGSMEQYNLLYVVSFWNTPNDPGNLLLTKQGSHSGDELQRAVAITVYGRPYLASESGTQSDILSYPTQSFSSRWNCVLDLSSRLHEEPSGETSVIGRSALPEPPSPFPGRTALSSFSSPAPVNSMPQAIAGKRHTLPGSITAMRAINPSTNFRLSLPQREHPGGSTMSPTPVSSYTPPSVALQAFSRPVLTASPSRGGGFGGVTPQLETFITTPTPTHHTFSHGTTPSTPHVQALGGRQNYYGPSVEIKRERGMGMMAAVPQTPGPTALNTQFPHRQDPLPGPSGEPVVVSVSILPAESDDRDPLGQRTLFPSDQFTLDIFVYNQSSWTRRFEVSHPSSDKRKWRSEQSRAMPGSSGKGSLEDLKASIAPPGILPLQNRVRVGPLRPSTCQSIRMDFLAISPGVHSVDILTLTDVETGYAVHLRNVMDIVVHERIVGKEEKVS